MPLNRVDRDILRFFEYGHLAAPWLQEVSAPFKAHAEWIADHLSGPEAVVALRKLLEAKDAAVRAALVVD